MILTAVSVLIGAAVVIGARLWAGRDKGRRDDVDELFALVVFLMFVVGVQVGDWKLVAVTAGWSLFSLVSEVRRYVRGQR